MSTITDSLMLWSPTNVTPTPMLDNPTSDDFDVIRNIRFYALALIIPVGIVANCLAFIVISLSYMSRGTTGHYLLSLALADTTLLIGELLFWMNTQTSHGHKMAVSFMDSGNFCCRVVFYIRYAGRLWSSWVTVIITAERLITISLPLKVGRISTPFKAKIVIVVQIIICLLLSMFVWFTLEVRPHRGTPRCQISQKYHDEYQISSIVVMGFGELVIPSVVVCLFTGLIIRKLSQASRARQRQLEGQKIARVPSSVSQERQLTYILLAVAVTFVAIRLPYVVTFYLNEYKKKLWPLLTSWESYYIYTANSIAYVCSVINYSINFFLYCLCGSTFRWVLISFCTVCVDLPSGAY